MREMVLNHASFLAPDADREVIVEWLRHVAEGMAQLVAERIVRIGLRMIRSAHETPCLEKYSLFQAYQDLRRTGYRDEYQFLVGLTVNTPLLSEIDQDVADRFLGCEGLASAAIDGEPLVLCAIAEWIAISLPSHAGWDRDQITVSFRELLPDDTFSEAFECIDNLARPDHVDPILERHRRRLLEFTDPLSLWENRHTVFPHLTFAPDVKDNLETQANLLSTIVGKLVDLDRSARDWRNQEGPTPPWRTKVSPESSRVMNNPALRDARKFLSHVGTREIFEWHARFGSGGRIHLRTISNSREIEIGYIGRHLPC